VENLSESENSREVENAKAKKQQAIAKTSKLAVEIVGETAKGKRMGKEKEKETVQTGKKNQEGQKSEVKQARKLRGEGTSKKAATTTDDR
jgi:hypothetical protein